MATHRTTTPTARTDEDSTGIVRAPGGRMDALLQAVRQVAPHKTTVLLGGESGTGKELVARALHAFSPRAAGPFVAVNCGAIPETLLESELFGHVRGAFTGAVCDRRGYFDEASGGTLLLDEIGELPLGLQVKLLRALEAETFRPVGAANEHRVDVRVVAATLRDLGAEVRAGRFREDLYYRLHVVNLELPPLRERPEDIAPLARHFVERVNARLGTRVTLTPEALARLGQHTWPGNVRELENAIERAVVLADDDGLALEALPAPMELRSPMVTHQTNPATSDEPALPCAGYSIKQTVRLVEAELIRRALRATAGNRTAAAKLLEISHRALLYKIKEYRLGEG